MHTEGFDDRTFWVYPWDITDQNPSDRLHETQSLGATAISIPFAYHSVRALAPHRLEAKIINASAAIYFQPNANEFSGTGIMPHCSRWASDEGPVPTLYDSARSLGLRLRAWTVIFHNSLLATSNPDSAITNCFGEVFAHALCPLASKSHAYAIELIRAIGARPIDAIDVEAAGFYGYEHLSLHDKCGVAFDLFHHFLFSCCFCAHCRLAISAQGSDPEFLSARFRDRLLRFFQGDLPPINQAEQVVDELCRLVTVDAAVDLLNARTSGILNLLREFCSVLLPRIELSVMSGLSPFECGALLGTQPEQLLHLVDRLLLPVFESDETRFRARLEKALTCIRHPSGWIPGIRVFWPDGRSQEDVESRLRFVETMGFRAVHIYHYGLAPQKLLTPTARSWKPAKGDV